MPANPPPTTRTSSSSVTGRGSVSKVFTWCSFRDLTARCGLLGPLWLKTCHFGGGTGASALLAHVSRSLVDAPGLTPARIASGERTRGPKSLSDNSCSVCLASQGCHGPGSYVKEH